MKNIDIARDSFHPLKNFSRVLKQQGRVELESDWNEQAAIALRCMRLMMNDLIGPYGGPESNCGFRVLVPNEIKPSVAQMEELRNDETNTLLKDCGAGDFVLSKGRYYVDGLMCEVHAPFRFTLQSDGESPPLAVELKGVHLVYLDVWETEVTWLQDDSIREVALQGADTAARMQIVWKVRAVTVDRSEKDSPEKNTRPGDLSPTWDAHVDSFQPMHRGAMSARTRQVHLDPKSDSSGTEGNFRGLENQLYRVEIHRGGKCAELGGATFKWSRDNGIAMFAVERCTHDDDRHLHVTLATTGRDDTMSLAIGDEVEFCDVQHHDHDLAGVLFEVVALDMPNRLVTLQRPVPLERKAAAGEIIGDQVHPLILRRWDHGTGAHKKGGLSHFEGALLMKEGAWLPIEDGIEIRFEPTKGHAVNHYRAGDYWLIPARVATGDVDWPQHSERAQPLPPHGVEHHYAPLALVDVNESGTTLVAPLTRRFGYHRLDTLARDVFARDGE
jgi:Family of unknown function (DUF6519)